MPNRQHNFEEEASAINRWHRASIGAILIGNGTFRLTLKFKFIGNGTSLVRMRQRKNSISEEVASHHRLACQFATII